MVLNQGAMKLFQGFLGMLHYIDAIKFANMIYKRNPEFANRSR